MGYIIYLSASPRMPELGRRPRSHAFRSIEEEPDAITYPGLLVLRIDSALYFANSDAPEDRLRELALAAEPPLHTIVIDFEGIDLIDSQGADALGKIVDLAGYNDIEVRFCRVKARIMEVLEADDLIERLGADRVFSNTYDAVADLIPPEDDTA